MCLAVNSILTVNHLKTQFFAHSGVVRAVDVDDVSFSLEQGKTFGIVGESVSGKSLTALSTLRLVPLLGKVLTRKPPSKGTPQALLNLRNGAGSILHAPWHTNAAAWKDPEN